MRLKLTDLFHVLQRSLLHALFLECHLAAADHLLDDLAIDATLCVVSVVMWGVEREGRMVVGSVSVHGVDSPHAGSTS